MATILIAVDGSKFAENALQCKYTYCLFKNHWKLNSKYTTDSLRFETHMYGVYLYRSLYTEKLPFFNCKIYKWFISLTKAFIL